MEDNANRRRQKWESRAAASLAGRSHISFGAIHYEHTLAKLRLIFAFNNLCFENSGTCSSSKYPNLGVLLPWTEKITQQQRLPHHLINFVLSSPRSAEVFANKKMLSRSLFCRADPAPGYIHTWRKNRVEEECCCCSPSESKHAELRWEVLKKFELGRKLGAKRVKFRKRFQ